MNLSEEQRKKIEENRRRALELRANKQQNVSSTTAANPMPRTKVSSNLFGQNERHAAVPGTTSNSTTTQLKPYSPASMGTKSYAPKNFLQKGYNSKKAGPIGCSNSRKLETSSGNDVATTTAKFVLLSRNRFVVDFKYFAPLVELMKSMETRQYDAQKRQWSFDIKEYSTLTKDIREKLASAVTIVELPKSLIRVLKDSNHISIPEADLSMVDPKLVETLLPFQREGVNFAIHREGRVLIADDMGLGKTIQALCVACYYRQDWPMLVVVPSSVRFAFQQQILEWLPSMVDPQQINVVLSGRDSCTSGLINIISYDLMVRCHKELVEQRFNVIIMDESHFLKNVKTARTKKAVSLLKKAKRVILLSGTPALSRPAELYTQLSVVDPLLFPSFHEYGIRYCDGKQMQWGWDYSGSSNMTELQIILEERIMIRRLKKDVLHQLPSKYRIMIVLDPGSVSVNKTMKVSHDMVGKMKGNERRGVLLQYFHETGDAKIKAVREYILDLLDSERKFIVFAHHQSMLDAIEEAVKPKYKYVRIDGRTSAEQRGFFCNKFQDKDDVRIAILSITAANAGINLTAASLVVFAELFWNPGILVQAEDRAHRIGQEDSVSVQYLVARHTADDYIWPLIQQKLSVLGKAGLSKDDFDETETRHLQDSKQRGILQYFNEGLFDENDSLDIDNTASDFPPSSSRTDITAYFSSMSSSALEMDAQCSGKTKFLGSSGDVPDDGAISGVCAGAEVSPDEWDYDLDDLAHCDDSFELDEDPSPKKSKSQ